MTLGSVMRLLVLAAIALPAPALADDASEGRRLFQKGEEYLRQGDYRAAADAFEAGYRMAPRSGFLLNIGNCYRKLGELGKARQYYWRFLDSAPKDHPSRPSVMEYLRGIEQIEADGVAVDPGARPPPAAPGSQDPAPPPAANEAPSRAPAPEPPAPLPEISAPAESPPAPLALREAPTEAVASVTTSLPPPPPASQPVWRRWWFWTAVGAAVAAGVVATVVVTRPAPSSCAATLGCARE